MELNAGVLLTQWSVRLAIACYLGRIALDIAQFDDFRKVSRAKLGRWLWTIGCLLYLLHVYGAFEFFHGWEHHRAFAHTATQTESLTGLRWGGGLYLNYAFTIFWMADTVAWWSSEPETHCRASGYFWTLHGIFAFMVFNATVVFGPSLWRWVAVIVGVALTIIYLLSNRIRRAGC